MSFVGSPFDHDIFVSYSHGSDAEGQPYLHEWSANFARELGRELRADPEFRNGLSIFLDQDLRPGKGVDPMAPLDDQLQCQIGASALLLTLMSPDYLNSQWCAQERDWWCARQRELGLPVEERIAVVRMWKTTQPWPPALVDSTGNPLVGFPFHAEQEGVDRPIGWTDAAGKSGTEYKKAMLGVVGRLYQKLAAMRQRLEASRRAEAEAAKLAQDGGQLIYLHGRAAHAAVWEQAFKALTDGGFAVLPAEPDPVEQDLKQLQRIREQRVETLSGCDALLLVGTDDARALEADLVVVGRQDRQSARARSNRLLPCGLLDTVGAAIATPNRRATARMLQTDWLDGTRDPWTPEVSRWLSEKGNRAGQAP